MNKTFCLKHDWPDAGLTRDDVLHITKARVIRPGDLLAFTILHVAMEIYPFSDDGNGAVNLFIAHAGRRAGVQ
jgi:hypothetical protein